MRTTLKRLGLMIAIGALALAIVPTGSAAAGQSGARYRVTIRTLTEGQPVTPPVIVTHRADFSLFQVGQIANVGVKEVAENGNVPALVSAVEQARGVGQVRVDSEPVVPEGLPGSAMFDDVSRLTIGAGARVHYLSFASMLICTNDGFTGIDSIRLPSDVGDTKRIGPPATTPAPRSTPRTSPTSWGHVRAWWVSRRVRPARA